MQVPPEKRIKVADTLRLFFHYCNIVNLTIGLIVFGVGVSLAASPLPYPINTNELSVVYGVVLITAVVVILMGILGIHGCYWVQENGLKFYAVSTILAIVLEGFLGSMSLLKESTIQTNGGAALEAFRGNESWESANTTYKEDVNSLHQGLSCCLFSNYTNISSCFGNSLYQISQSPLPNCTDTFQDFVSVKFTYIRCLSFMLIPIQLLCLGFDLMVLKTLQVTKEYDKLERELSNKKREKRNSQGYLQLVEVKVPKPTKPSVSESVATSPSVTAISPLF